MPCPAGYLQIWKPRWMILSRMQSCGYWIKWTLSGVKAALQPGLKKLPPDPEKLASQSELLEMIDKIMSEELTDRQRTALLAIVQGGMPLEEVARRMDTNRNALYKLLHDARKQMRARILEKGLTAEEVLAVFGNE